MFDPLSRALRQLRSACDQGSWTEAARLLADMQRLDPGHPLTRLAQARLAQAQGQAEAACTALEAALAADPDLFDAWLALGQLQAGLRRYSPALASLSRALALRPLDAEALRLLIALLQLTGDIPAVAACLGLLLDPDLARQPAYARLTPAAREALGRSLPAWQALGIVNAFGWSEAPLGPQLQAWGSRWLADLPPVPGGHAHLLPEPERPLRVGYVSSEWESPYLRHVWFSAWQHADPERFALIAYRDDRSDPAEATLMPPALQGSFSGVRASRAMGDLQFYHQVRADRIDVLVDLSGLFNARRLSALALRPAPVQINGGANPPFALGLGCFDAVFSDAVLLPEPSAAGSGQEGLDEAHAPHEPVRYLDCFMLWQPPAPAPPNAPAPAPKVPHAGLRLGAGVSPNKLSDETLRLWAQVLAALPEARLTLKNQAWLDAGVRERLRARFAAAGGDGSRLDFEDNLARQAMIPFFAECDLVLEAHPYAGALSICDAYWAGVPVPGLRSTRRIAEAMRHCLASPELLADRPDDYLARTVALARDPARLAAYRRDLPQRLLASPAMAANSQMQRIEGHYRALWQSWIGRK